MTTVHVPALVIFVIVFNSVNANQVLVGAECPIGWIHFRSSCFYFSSDRKSWYTAEGSCRGHNGRLAEVYDKSTSDYLFNLAHQLGGGEFWLGGRDDVAEGVWVWASTDQQFSLTAWSPGEPNNMDGNEDCVKLQSYGDRKYWNDDNCDKAERFVCEIEYPGDRPFVG